MSQIASPEMVRRNTRRRRLISLGILGVLLVVGAMACRHYWYARPIGHGPAGPAVDRQLFANVWSHRPVLLVGIGDSVTAGFGASPDHGYFDRLVKNPPDEFADVRGLALSHVLPRLASQNLALSGSTSLECLDMLVPKIDEQNPEVFGVIVMTTGGNDIIHNYGRTPPREGAMYGATLEQARPWIDNFAQRLDRILNEIENKFPGGCAFFIANIYDPTDGIGDAQNAGLPAWPDGLAVIRAYNDVIAKTANRRANVHLIDMHGAFLGHGIHCCQFWRSHYRRDDPHYWYFDNLEDPNDRGYDALRRLFLIEISKVLPSLLKNAENEQPIDRESP